MPTDSNTAAAAPAAAPAAPATKSSTTQQDEHLSTQYTTLPERVSRDFDAPGTFTGGNHSHDPVSPHAVSLLESSGSPPFRTPSTASQAFNPTHNSVGTHRVSMLEPVGDIGVNASGTGNVNVNRESEGLEVVSPPSQYHQDHGPIPYTENYGPQAEKKGQFQEDHGPIPYVQSYQPDIKHGDGNSYPKGYVAVQQTTDQEGLTDHSFDKFVPPAGAKAQKYHGLTKKQWIIVGVIGAIVALAIIIGAVVGSLAHKNSSSSPAATPSNSTNNSSTPISSTQKYAMLGNGGLGATTSTFGDATRLMYFQTINGSIAENVYRNKVWTQQSSKRSLQASSGSVLPVTAGLSTPLTALMYNFNGVSTRQVFYVDGTGLVNTISSTTPIGTYPVEWSNPVQISTTATATSASAGLAACAINQTDTLDHLHVFYGDSNEYISQYSFNLTNSSATWELQWQFEGDARSGLACTLYRNNGTNGINLYYRNASISKYQQWYADFDEYGEPTDDWWQGPTFSQPTYTNSKVAACNDGQQTEYVFFQNVNNTINRWVGDSAYTEGWRYYIPGTLYNATAYSRLAATCGSDGVSYLYQNTTNSSVVWDVSWSRTGQLFANGPVLSTP